MSTTELYILIIGTALAFIILIIIFWLLFKNYFTSFREKSYHRVEDELSKVSIDVLNNYLRKIEILSKNNKIYQDHLTNLSYQYDQLLNDYQQIKQSLEQNNQKSSLFSHKQYSRFINTVIEEIKVIQFKYNSFCKESDDLLQANQFLLKEMTYYRARLAKILFVYEQKVTQIEPLLENLANLNSEIINLNMSFEKEYQKGDVVFCGEIITNYREKILQFAIILNEAPIMGNIIYNRIPQLIKALTENYRQTKEKYNFELIAIKYSSFLELLYQHYETAQKLYKDLNLTGAKNEILWIFKNIKSIEVLIASEVQAHNLLKKQYQYFENNTRKIFENYLKLLKKYKKSKEEQNTSYPLNYEVVQEMRKLVKEIDGLSMDFLDDFKDSTIPYTSKLFKLKNIFQLENSLLLLMNKFIKNFSYWKNIKEIVISDKNWQEEVVRDIYKNINQHHIGLSQEESKKLESLDFILLKLDQQIVQQKLDMDKINELAQAAELELLWVNNVIKNKIKIAEIIRNLLSHFAIQRSNNRELNQTLEKAQSQYLQNNYLVSLNTIINFFERR